MSTRVVRGIRSYIAHLHFQRNAWLYLTNAIMASLALGGFGLLFNFYAVSLGYSKLQIGTFATARSLATLLAAMPAGYLTDRLGRKISLLAASALVSGGVLGIALWRTAAGFYAMYILMGLAQSLAAVTLGPFLMENSRNEDRTYLFSFQAGATTLAGSLGNLLGGQLPTWVYAALGSGIGEATAYTWSIAGTAAASLLALLPLFLLRRQQTAHQRGEHVLSPFQYARRYPKELAKLNAPQLVIGLGAGLLIPFLNLFFANAHQRSVAEIGALFSWSSLAMGLGFLLAAPLAERFGKMRIIVITQALSIPFLILLGFAPWYWVSAAAFLIRAALMNMSGPVYNNFVMEQAEPESRASVASLVNMSWTSGQALSTSLSGWVQDHYGFYPLFWGTISTYVAAIWMYWRFFWRGATKEAASEE